MEIFTLNRKTVQGLSRSVVYVNFSLRFGLIDSSSTSILCCYSNFILMMRAQRAIAVINDSRILSSRCGLTKLNIASRAYTNRAPSQFIVAPLRVEGRRYFSLTRPRYAAASAASDA